MTIAGNLLLAYTAPTAVFLAVPTTAQIANQRKPAQGYLRVEEKTDNASRFLQDMSSLSLSMPSDPEISYFASVADYPVAVAYSVEDPVAVAEASNLEAAPTIETVVSMEKIPPTMAQQQTMQWVQTKVTPLTNDVVARGSKGGKGSKGSRGSKGRKLREGEDNAFRYLQDLSSLSLSMPSDPEVSYFASVAESVEEPVAIAQASLTESAPAVETVVSMEKIPPAMAQQQPVQWIQEKAAAPLTNDVMARGSKGGKGSKGSKGRKLGHLKD